MSGLLSTFMGDTEPRSRLLALGGYRPQRVLQSSRCTRQLLLVATPSRLRRRTPRAAAEQDRQGWASRSSRRLQSDRARPPLVPREGAPWLPLPAPRVPRAQRFLVPRSRAAPPRGALSVAAAVAGRVTGVQRQMRSAAAPGLLAGKLVAAVMPTIFPHVCRQRGGAAAPLFPPPSGAPHRSHPQAQTLKASALVPVSALQAGTKQQVPVSSLFFPPLRAVQLSAATI